MSTVRVRIAPSPTGLFHLGSLRTALTNYLFARKEKGVFLVRVEDTDQNRLVPEAIPDMLASLKWAGLEINEGVIDCRKNVNDSSLNYTEIKKNIIQKGNFGPYIQSERLEIYRRYADELLRKKIAYPCFCRCEELDKMRKRFLKKGLPPKYDRSCLKLSDAEVKSRMVKEPFVLRLKTPLSGKTSFVDLIRGKIEIENELLDDPIIMKSDGFPTYHFAVVVDDHLMKISHVFRGEEWISSTPKHLLIYKAFGWKPPVFGHLTNILNMHGGKLSKRDGSVSIADFRQKGFLPEAIINFIALLGWNPKDNRELFSLSELIKEFDTKKLNKAAPRFDQQRLDWFGKYYLGQKSLEELSFLSAPYLQKLTDDQTLIKKIAQVQQSRMHVLGDITQDIDFVFKLPNYSSDLLIWKDTPSQIIKENLRSTLKIISDIKLSDFSLSNLEKLLMTIAGENRGSFLWPLRVALSGKQKSPSPFECAWLLGRDESIRRIEKAVSKISNF